MAGFIRILRKSGTVYKTRRQWGARYRASLNRFDPPGEYLFLHISVTRKSGSFGDRMRLIEWIGVQRFSRTHFPYIEAAFENGHIYQGQPRLRKGAHTVNDKDVAGYPYDLNAYGHACVIPQMPEDPVTDAQADAIARWGAAKVLSGDSTATKIEPHRKFAWKSCPSDPAVARLDEINRLFRQYVDEGLDSGPKINLTQLQSAYKRGGKVFNKSGRVMVRRWVRALRDNGYTVKGFIWKTGWFGKHVQRATGKHATNNDLPYGQEGWPSWKAAVLLGLEPYTVEKEDDPGPKINMTHLQSAYARPKGRVFNPWGQRANRTWHKALKDAHKSGPKWNWTRAWFDKHLRASTRHANIDYGIVKYTGDNRDRPTWALAKRLNLRPHWAGKK